MSRRDDPNQLSLFGNDEDRAKSTPSRATPPESAATRISPAAIPAELAALAAALPSAVRLGTSSWSFPGWRGLVYADAYAERELARAGLAAYARHPLLRAVGIDKGYYAPVAVEEFRRLAAQTPPDFRFLVKAYDQCVTPFFTQRTAPRGERAGAANPHFLDVRHALESVVQPYLDGLGAQGAALVWQFSKMNLRALGGVNAFLERLREFLRALPAEPTYAVELRNAEAFCPRYFDVLSETGARHCFNVHPAMPPFAEQVADLGALAVDGPVVVRWMLQRTQEYEAARERYAPFDRLVDEDLPSRGAIADLARRAAAAGFRVIIIVNNKAEGSAPRSCFALAQLITGE